MISSLNLAAVNAEIVPTRLDALWQAIQRQLEDEKARIFQEISHYPPPIPACDVQFNALLEEQVAVLKELGQVKMIRKQRLSAGEQIALLDELTRSARFLGDDLVKQARCVVMAPAS